MTPTKTKTSAEEIETASPTVLELRQVSYYGGSENSIRLASADLVIREAELITLHIDLAISARSMASLLLGLSDPFKGDVLFQNKPWSGGTYHEHFEMRSRIGRVFEGQAWIQNLNIAENITLACQHSGRSTESIEKDVAYWTTLFGISELSKQRPAFLQPSLLQIHQWVRAFIGNPRLLILERPMNSVASTLLPRLVDAVNEIRRRGAAVLWFTSDPAVKQHHFQKAHLRYELQNQKPVPLSGV